MHVKVRLGKGQEHLVRYLDVLEGPVRRGPHSIHRPPAAPKGAILFAKRIVEIRALLESSFFSHLEV
jgi:hypothetical protein